jgi:hypothetical protein
MTLLGESRDPARLFFLALLMVAIVGLKFTSHDEVRNPPEPAGLQETGEH